MTDPSGAITSSDKLRRALEPVATQLRADGYELHADTVGDDRIRVEIVAGPEACEECLVAKPIMTQIVVRALPGVGADVIEVVYPGESTDH